MLEKRIDYAHWLRDLFDGLNIEKGNLLGHSYGGWLALNMALAYPMGFLAKLGLRLSGLKIRPPARSVLKMIASRKTVFEETFVHLMEMVTKYCVPAIMFPTVYTDEELKQIEIPARLLVGGEEKIYNPDKAIRRARRFMPHLSAEIIPNIGHILIMEQPEKINSRILAFLNGRNP